MNLLRPFVFLPTALLTLALGATLTSTEACGNDVADCGVACPATIASGTCANECTALQTACTTANDIGDFQALLTCVANSGNALSPLPVDCQTQYNTAEANCTGTGGTDSGTTGSGSGSGVGSNSGIGSGSTGFTCTGTTDGSCPAGEYCCGGAGGFGYECVTDGDPCPL